MAEQDTVIDYASKYSEVIDERFKIASITDAAVSHDYNFDGVKKIHVYSAETVELNDYDRKATSNRYGTPKELGLAAQEYELKQDKSFAFTIDKGNYNDTVMASSAGKALQREIDEVITPTIDKYRISKWVENAGTTMEGAASLPAYTAFLDASAELTEKLVPATGRIAFVSTAFYKSFKLDAKFTGTGDKATEIAKTGALDMVDGTRIIVTPSSYFPDSSIAMIIVHPSATLGPVKLAEYLTHPDPPGISGWLCEGRVYYDAFVLKNKKDAVLVYKTAAAETT